MLPNRLFDAAADILSGIKEEKGGYDYKDVVNAAGCAYAKLYAEIEKRYEDSSVRYYKLDGTPVTMEDELAWLDQEYETTAPLSDRQKSSSVFI